VPAVDRRTALSQPQPSLRGLSAIGCASICGGLRMRLHKPGLLWISASRQSTSHGLALARSRAGSGLSHDGTRPWRNRMARPSASSVNRTMRDLRERLLTGASGVGLCMAAPITIARCPAKQGSKRRQKDCTTKVGWRSRIDTAPARWGCRKDARIKIRGDAALLPVCRNRVGSGPSRRQSPWPAGWLRARHLPAPDRRSSASARSRQGGGRQLCAFAIWLSAIASWS
jgi:hypothetical protein